MAMLANDDVLEVTMDGTYQGSRVLNVWHYKVVGLAAPVDYEDAVTAALTKWKADVWTVAAGLQDVMVNTYLLDRLRGQVVFPTRKPYIDLAVAENGQLMELGAPSNTAMVQTLRSAMVGKGTSGSKHFTGLSSVKLDAAFWDSEYTADVQVAAARATISFNTAAPAVSYDAGLYNRTSGAFNEIISTITSTEVRIMRRRTVHLGI